MKNYLLSFLYCLIYLSITIMGFGALCFVFDAQTYHTILMTCLILGLGMSLFLSVWFKQDELFFLLFLTLLTYCFIGFFNRSDYSSNSYYNLIAFPLTCLLYPINVYFLFQVTSGDSFFRTFLKKLFILSIEIVVIYFFTYFVPFLLGPSAFLAFETTIGKILYFSFIRDFSFPVVSIFSFIICWTLTLHRRQNTPEQIQACVSTLFCLTFLSFFLISIPSLFQLSFLAGVLCVLFSLLQISHKMAFLDELTNIPGRRALMTQLKQIESDDYTLAMLDIDHFKRLNDSYGHEVGDQALRTIAATISQHVTSGTLYRYGGEEFVLLYPKKSIDDILDQMENARVLVSNSNFFLTPNAPEKKQKNQPYMASVQITLSIGVTQKQPLQTYDEVINIADQALYKAKQTGRNKTVYNKAGKFFELFRADNY